MPFTQLQQQAATGPYALEVEVAIRVAQVMRGAGADLGADHPWRDRFDELAAQFEQDAVAVAALPAPEGPAVPPLRLVL